MSGAMSLFGQDAGSLSSETSFRRFPYIYSDSSSINAREQSGERGHDEAIPSEPRAPHSQETFTAGIQVYNTVPSQGSTSRVSHLMPTQGLQVPQLASESTSPARRHAPVAVSAPNKKQNLGENNSNRKMRMLGKKGEDDGFIPNWERMTPYAMSTLRNKIGSTKIIK
ncbi:hypothetical protein PMIN03_009159 [Paraphaeosphaeria minitans]|uniref:Uncharacterized protein n=1 Tax=Paraphaeosphaeria minitans TaxID=565426 RepID=A0A9P6GQ83_9PLEO|nr:hypothetical protein PMIN01_02045 [Paraphaeosphaeria minitans]